MANRKCEDVHSKALRHQAILRIIRGNTIHRQEELLALLRQEGFPVTQATISRDIRELNLVKTSVEGQGYCYAAPRDTNGDESPDVPYRFETIFRESVLLVDYAGHIVLVKCYAGMANAACQVFDSLHWKNVVGTLSGDDTFFILARTERDAKAICSDLLSFLKK